ncbi:hypothetical protein [Bacillus phage FI_KG-Lek]|nr:hypothetical protein [Bacillus phage FI_KG-Lek]
MAFQNNTCQNSKDKGTIGFFSIIEASTYFWR